MHRPTANAGPVNQLMNRYQCLNATFTLPFTIDNITL